MDNTTLENLNIRVQHVRGTKAQMDSYTGRAGELSVDQTSEEVRVLDGVTVGGKFKLLSPVAMLNYINVNGGLSSLASKISIEEKGAPNGIATLGSDGKVPSSQLPTYVDAVQEYPNLAVFPTIGSSSVIYLALDTNRSYRWSGTVYSVITSGSVDSVNGLTGVVTIPNATTTVAGLMSSVDKVKLDNVGTLSEFNANLSAALA